MVDPKKIRNDKLGPEVVKALQKRHFEAYYFLNSKDAVQKVLDLIPQTDSVSWGGTMTVDSLGIKDLLSKRGNKLIDRDAGKTPAEKEELMRQALLVDTFLMSSNAITQKGELFNIDGKANRVAALCFGPKSVIIVAGINKIVPDMDAAYKKVRNYTAPINSQRFNIDTPCMKNGECADCINVSSICAQFVTTRICRPEGRIKVILIGEDLGI